MKSNHSFSLFIACILAASAASAETGAAVIKGTIEGAALTGMVALQDTPDGLQVTAKLRGLPPGQHGFHIHEFGDCGDLGKAAGSHYNPLHAGHGDVMKAGMKHAHAGDMGNITADANGEASVQVVIKKLTLSGGKYGAAGRALIIHENPDDFSQPAGNAGGRIGCGVIVIVPPAKS